MALRGSALTALEMCVDGTDSAAVAAKLDITPHRAQIKLKVFKRDGYVTATKKLSDKPSVGGVIRWVNHFVITDKGRRALLGTIEPIPMGYPVQRSMPSKIVNSVFALASA